MQLMRPSGDMIKAYFCKTLIILSRNKIIRGSKLADNISREQTGHITGTMEVTDVMLEKTGDQLC
jgi:hypothetical protein